MEAPLPYNNLIEFEKELKKLRDSYGDNSPQYVNVLKTLLHSGLVTDKVVLVELQFQIGRSYHLTGNNQLAMQYFQNAYKLCKTAHLTANLGKIYNGLGAVYMVLGRNALAIKNYLKAIETGDDLYKANAYNNLSVIYNMKRQFSSALQYYQKALDLSKKLKAWSSVAAIYTNMGNTYFSLNKYEKSIEFHKKSYNLSNSKNILQYKILSLINIADCYIHTKEYRKVSENIETASKLIKDNYINMYMPSVYLIKGSLEEKQKNYEQALKHYYDAFNLTKNADEDIAEKSLMNIRRIYARLKQPQNGYKALTELNKIIIKRTRSEREKRLRELQLEFEAKEKEIELNHLRRENEFKSTLLKKNREIERHYSELIQVNEELKQFNYAVSHDLKEPLRNIISFSDLLDKKYRYKVLDDNALEFLKYIVDSTKRMNSMLSDLLTYTTVNRENVKVEECDLEAIISEVKQNLQMVISESGAKIDLQCQIKNKKPKMYHSQLVQLFQNLFSNSIKFRKPGKSLRIKVSIKENAKHEYHVTVKDNGIGISVANPNSLFQIFRKGQQNGNYQGSGIGLALCQKVVRNHSGKIAFDTESVKDGTCIQFHLKPLE